MNELYYLNIKELYYLCNYLKIPYFFYKIVNNKLVKLSYKLSKKDIIKRLIKLINGKKSTQMKPIIIKDFLFSNQKINSNLNENNFIYVNQYKNGNKYIYNLLNKLTNNQFSFGALSCYLIRKIFMRNKLITYKQFASLYIKYLNKNIEHPEWMYINYQGFDWHTDRDKIAKRLIKYFLVNY